MYKSGGKNGWVLLLMLLAGVVIGGFMGTYLGRISYLNWLAFGMDFGLNDPLVLDLGVLVVQFGIRVKLTISGILGIAFAVVLYKKLRF